MLLGYLTVSQGGLSELELQDILSLDDTLLKELKINLKQPNNVLIVPFFYILPILQDLQRHLVVRPDNGFYVIYWRHKLFGQIVHEKYICEKCFEIQLHVNISEYYLDKWSQCKKNLEYEEPTAAASGQNKKKVSMIQTNRLIPKQPLEYESFHSLIKARLNLRKLSMLPYHLMKAEMIDSNFKTTHTSFSFIIYLFFLRTPKRCLF